MCSGTSRPAVADVAQVVPNVVVLADDLIWATRLAQAITAAGAHPQPARRLADLERLLAPSGGSRDGDRGAGTVGFAIVDLTARAYDGVEAVRTAHGTGARVVAVGQHDDAALRRAAMAAGAERVYTYRALFEDGPRTLGAWLAR
jgi:DNA-binding NarL/FixJ family response regulator